MTNAPSPATIEFIASLSSAIARRSEYDALTDAAAECLREANALDGDADKWRGPAAAGYMADHRRAMARELSDAATLYHAFAAMFLREAEAV